MLNKKITQLSVTVAMLMAGTTAQAATWKAGDWDLGLGGNINAHYSITSCSNGDNASGGTTLTGLACAGSTDENGNLTDAHNIQNGLLPASLNFSAKTNQDGWDISANINVYYGLGSQGGAGSDALAFSTVDARQVYLTFGKADSGEFKFGRDFGLFGFDAVIGDMSLVGVGANFAAPNFGHTSLGGLGYGYVYTDRLAQMNYTTADMGGFKITGGVFQPNDGSGATSAGDIGIHAKATMSQGPLTASASFITQSVVASGTSQDISGFDVAVKYNLGNIDLMAYLFDAEGMSSLALGGLVLPGFGGTGTPEETSGTMLQATMKVNQKLKVGINISSSEQEKVTLVENDRLTIGAYYNLTKSLTLLGEFTSAESKLAAGSDENTVINFGAFLGF